MVSNLQIIHLSDLHIHDEKDIVLKRIEALPICLGSDINIHDEIVLIVSRDIAFSGTQKQFQLAENNFKKLSVDIKNITGKLPTWILVPGNHDGTFKESSQIRIFTIESVLKLDDVSTIDDSVITTTVAPLKEYFAFAERMQSNTSLAIFRDPLLTIHEIRISGKIISFWQINASWLSKVPETQGELQFPVAKYSEHLRREADFRIAVLHHPINWYTQQTYHPLRQLLNRNFALVFTGHEHVNNGFIQREIGSERSCIFLSAGALGPHHSSEKSEFSTLNFDVLSGKIEQRSFHFSEESSRFLENESSRKGEQVSLVSARDFHFTDAAIESLEEMAAPFSHPVKDVLRLSDVYVEPSFTALTDAIESKNNIGVDNIVKNLEDFRKVLVRADDHHGKTSLLNHIANRLILSGQVPVKISAPELSKSNDNRRERAIDEAVADFYGDEAVSVFKATDRSRKVLLIDNIDCLGANPELYVRAFEFSNRYLSHPGRS